MPAIRRSFTISVLAIGCTGALPEKAPIAESIGVVRWTAAEVVDAAGIMDVAVGDGPDDGHWVLFNSPVVLGLYTYTGELAGRYIRRGQGPAEALAPVAITTNPGSRSGSMIWDIASSRLIEVNASSQTTVTHELPIRSGAASSAITLRSYGNPNRMRSFGGGVLIQVERMANVGTMGHLNAGVLVWVRFQLNHVRTDTLLIFDQLRAVWPQDMARAEELSPIILWSTCSDQALAVYDPGTSQITVSDTSGRVKWQRTVEGQDVPVTHADRKTVLRRSLLGEADDQRLAISREEIERTVSRVAREAASLFPDMRPKAVDLLCDAAQRVWLQSFLLDDVQDVIGKGNIWRVYGRAEPVRIVVLPTGFQPQGFTQGGVVGVMQDQVGVQRLALVEVPGF